MGGGVHGVGPPRGRLRFGADTGTGVLTAGAGKRFPPPLYTTRPGFCSRFQPPNRALSQADRHFGAHSETIRTSALAFFASTLAGVSAPTDSFVFASR